ncbi:hypothetical protein [Candidatus Villigracilis affinis]|uniref:hypothetical protein n=1 Tax=Candidatus Villigracilis affinis TaxID=3140682 RepID=UPI001DB71F01|nr:hypothetical protein [Anaerolineales bacterium]
MNSFLSRVQACLREAVKRRWDRRPGAMSIAEFVETLGTINVPEAAMPLALLRPSCVVDFI